MGFTSQEFIEYWVDNTKRIAAGKNGCVTPAMCEREKSSKPKPLEHGFMLRGVTKVKLRKNQLIKEKRGKI